MTPPRAQPPSGGRPVASHYRYSVLAAALAGALAPAYVIRWHVGPLPTTLLEVALLVTIAVFAVETMRQGSQIEWRGPPMLVDVHFFKNDLSLEFWALLGILWAADRWSGAGSALYRRGPR